MSNGVNAKIRARVDKLFDESHNLYGPSYAALEAFATELWTEARKDLAERIIENWNCGYGWVELRHGDLHDLALSNALAASVSEEKSK